jgi:hypothetical protein
MFLPSLSLKTERKKRFYRKVSYKEWMVDTLGLIGDEGRDILR